MSETSKTLKRFQGALAGHILSGTAAYEINTALCEGRPYKHFCEQGEKLPGIHKDTLQRIVDRMMADGVKPAASLLTAHQKQALRRRLA